MKPEHMFSILDICVLVSVAIIFLTVWLACELHARDVAKREEQERLKERKK